MIGLAPFVPESRRRGNTTWSISKLEKILRRPLSNLANFVETLLKGHVVSSHPGIAEKINDRTVEEDAECKPPEHTMAEVYAPTMRRLSKGEARADPADRAD